MSRKNKPQYHEPTDYAPTDTDAAEMLDEGDVVLIEDTFDGSVDVGTVLLVDGPIDPVPLGTNSKTIVDFGAAAAKTADQAPEKISDKTQDIQNKTQDIQDKVQDKAQDMAQNVTQTAHDLAGKAQDKAQDIAGKAQEAAQGLADKAQDLTKAVADKAQGATHKIADSASSAKTTVATAGSTSKSAVADAASTAGMTLWGIMQRNPLQAIVFLASLVWLLRNNSATAGQPAVSVSDAAGDAAQKVGSVAGQVQVAANNLSSQVQTHAQQGAGWFSQTLQSNPLAIGAMGIIFGAGLGFAVPETSYEHQTLGKTRDALADKAQAAAQDLGHKVQTVAQTAVHEAIESGKEEAKNQGLTPQQ